MVGDGLVVKISDFGLSRENVVHTMSDGDKHIMVGARSFVTRYRKKILVD